MHLKVTAKLGILALALGLGAGACVMEGDEPEVAEDSAELSWRTRTPDVLTTGLDESWPTITGFTPSSAKPGETITISGRNFTGSGRSVAWKVYLGNTPMAYQVESSTKIRATVPQGQTGGYIFLKTFGTYITAQSGGRFLTAPSNLTVSTLSTSAIQLSWSDNSNDETSYQVWWTNPSWQLLGSVGANTASEPITELAPNNTRQYKVRAVRNGAVSAFSNAVIGTTSTTPPPTVSFSNGFLSPLLNGNATVKLDRSGNPLVWGIFDANHDGIVAGEASANPGASGSVYPRWRGSDCGVYPGARFAPGANMIFIAQIETWSTQSRPQFVALHVAVNESTGTGTVGTLVGGDLSAVSTGMVLGAANPPTVNVQSHFDGTASGSAVGHLFATSCATNTISGVTVDFHFDRVSVYNDDQ